MATDGISLHFAEEEEDDDDEEDDSELEESKDSLSIIPTPKITTTPFLDDYLG